MAFLSPITCLLGRHEPLRRYVKWNGRKYVGKCRHCRTPIERVSHKQWREREDASQDDMAEQA